ncbi:uncharacterized protein LOC123509615 [Portunus trituberculatus]|uniref:uncharacterized protein LOC123509615 n=1 Tax=Portunus trituberculatus TaxID=210409 RepID=UPI001E1CE7AD|nr:uncharacterized protein LOC123509615 [Portunus trituberculatus]
MNSKHTHSHTTIQTRSTMASRGIDIHLLPHRKLYIGELTEKNGTFYIDGKTVKHVDILGTVTSILRKARHTTMMLDDNTATITCIRFHAEEEEEEVEEARVDEDKQEDFSMFVKRVTQKWQRRVEHGDVVNVLGRVDVYKGRWQVVVSSVVVVEDSNAEWFRLKEIEAQRKALKLNVRF